MTKSVNAIKKLQKFSGKGGWTYIDIPEIPMDKHSPFGWVRVSGSIDNHPFERVKLMPKGDGSLFLPLNAKVRKAISKNAGDEAWVNLTVISDLDTIPKEVIECLLNEPPQVMDAFNALSDFDKNIYIGDIMDAKTDDQKADRIVRMIEKLSLT